MSHGLGLVSRGLGLGLGLVSRGLGLGLGLVSRGLGLGLGLVTCGLVNIPAGPYIVLAERALTWEMALVHKHSDCLKQTQIR